MAEMIIFCFAGRRANMELQLPFIRRILNKHPDTEYHIWDLARDDSDHQYLHTIKGNRITVRDDHYGYRGFDRVYKHYAQPRYQDCLFVKIDDDVVFLETARFGQFVAAIDAYRGSILSANVINNGACTPLEPGLWQAFEASSERLLEVHKSSRYAELAHNYFFNHQEMLHQPVQLIPTEDWLSINLIGYDWEMACYITNRLGMRPQAQMIAHRKTSFHAPLGDEAIVNMLPRIVMKGFLGAHLGFGPQYLTDQQEVAWRERYAEIGQHYLASGPSECNDELPGLSPVSRAYADARDRRAARWGANDWRARWA